ncbi:MAG: hypothetical protein NT029_17660 [Armatimonadetes bacterium]|nr:hypothetical protein [Armatimonadota bacterium]
MSRTMTIGSLLVLILGLVAVSFAIQKTMTPEKPQPPDPRKMAAAQKAQMEAQTKMRMQAAQEQQTKIKEALTARPKPQVPNPPKVSPGAGGGHMDIASDWFKKRSDGASGIDQAAKEAAAEAAKPPVKMQAPGNLTLPGGAPRVKE